MQKIKSNYQKKNIKDYGYFKATAIKKEALLKEALTIFHYIKTLNRINPILTLIHLKLTEEANVVFVPQYHNEQDKEQQFLNVKPIQVQYNNYKIALAS